MLEQTLEPTRLQVPEPPPPDHQRRRSSATDLVIKYRWPLSAVALLLVSLALVLWAGTRPGYDPYGWLVWGKLTIHGKLDTNGAPSWKPFPFLLTVPYALAGHYALWLWMVTAVAVSLAGPIFAWRIAFWLTEAPPARRYASYAAGAFAAAAVFGISPVAGTALGYTHFIFSAQSDPMMVTMCLAAVDCHLCGRRRWAFWLWVLAALVRPEAWLFLAIYAVYLWRACPSMRKWVAGGLLLQPLLWFGIPGLTAKTWFVAGVNALNSPRALHQSLILGTIQRFHALQANPVWIAAAIVTALAFFSVPPALLRHPRVWWSSLGHMRRWTLILAGGALGWLVVEIAFVLHGWPGVPRYMFPGAGAVAVLAGMFVGRVILDVPPLIARIGVRRVRPQLAGRLGNWGALLVLALLLGAMLPAARTAARAEHLDLRHERARTAEIDRLSTVVRTLGASRILSCGKPNIPYGYQSVFAWYTGIKIGVLYIAPGPQKHVQPFVNLFPTPTGWLVFPSHLTASSPAYCRNLLFRS